MDNKYKYTVDQELADAVA